MKKQKQSKKGLILSFVFPLLTLMEIFISHEISSASRGREGAGGEIVREGLDLPEAACFSMGFAPLGSFPCCLPCASDHANTWGTRCRAMEFPRENAACLPAEQFLEAPVSSRALLTLRVYLALFYPLLVLFYHEKQWLLQDAPHQLGAVLYGFCLIFLCYLHCFSRPISHVVL